MEKKERRLFLAILQTLFRFRFFSVLYSLLFFRLQGESTRGTSALRRRLINRTDMHTSLWPGAPSRENKRKKKRKKKKKEGRGACQRVRAHTSDFNHIQAIFDGRHLFLSCTRWGRDSKQGPLGRSSMENDSCNLHNMEDISAVPFCI